ncbi:ABC transporter permease [Weizmannia acidilactici]|uniref:ABC transporter permease n=1 Tax=Weizmannia acidilactici TaxID=2607726 RepID=A0A5J4JJT7_9BACI|nr:ABC transporter permease [Weizmannia acidilactici]GER70788.1 ABC transporter permease [Weizmannia acidilactici]GER74352.1 ABC transporter permease [Weizmannia acidilactici]
MRTAALIKRILLEMLRDKRTLALLFVAPLLILTLMYFFFSGNTTDPKLGVSHVDKSLVKVLDKADINVKHYSTVKHPEKTVLGYNLDGLLQKKDGAYILTLQNSDPTSAKSLQMKVKQAIAAGTQQQLAKQIKAEAQTIQGAQKIIALQNQAQQILMKQTPAQSPAIVKVQQLEEQVQKTKQNLPAPVKVKMAKPNVSTKYVYGSSDTVFFDVLSPILVGFFVFFFVFLISGIGLLKERTSGTLNRLMATPVKRGEIVMAYLAGFGIFAIIQTVIVVLYSVNVLDMVLAGSLWHVVLINLMLALVALSLGILLSSFAASEFQMMQFIPIVVVPQVFFSGIIPLKGMADWLQELAKVMPIYYGADALKRVMYEGLGLGDVWKDLLALAVFAVIFIILNILALRRYRAL